MNETSLPSGAVTLSPETGHLYISPIGFFGRAEEFLDASVLLSTASGRFSFVAADLACHSIELFLKAFLLARGYSVKRVKNLGHSLQKILVDSYARGIETVVDLTADERDLLLVINQNYMGGNFAYFDLESALVQPKPRDLELLPVIARKLQEGVKEGCLIAVDGKWTPVASERAD